MNVISWSAPSRTVEVSVLQHDADLAAIASDWQALWHRVGHAVPFVSPAWLLPWWQHLGGGSLRVFTARVQRRLVAILPMFVHVDDEGRRLLPFGVGVSDYFDLLAEPDWVDAALQVIVPALLRPNDEWDRCEFHELRADSALLQLRRSGLATADPQSVCPLLTIARFAASGTRAGAQRGLRRSRRKAVAAGAVIEPVPVAGMPEAVEDLFALHTDLWRTRGQDGVFADGKVRDFHRAVARRMDDGALLIYRLRLGDRIGGVFYGFRSPTRAFGYALGTDPTLEALSPGRLLLGAAIEAAVEAGATHFDFLRGQEPYKYAWGAQDRRTFRLDVRTAAARSAPPFLPPPVHLPPAAATASFRRPTGTPEPDARRRAGAFRNLPEKDFCP